MFAALQNVGRFISQHPLTRQRRIAAAGRYLKWQIHSRIQQEIIFDWIAGAKLAARRGMTGATGNIYAGLHEFHDMAFALHFLRPGDIFADIGANVGSYTVLASGVAGARTIAFEPDPITAAHLMRNVELNRISGLVSVHMVALGAESATARFSIGRDTENHVVGPEFPNARDVMVETLDQAAAKCIPTLIKLDVEGYEAQVLQGARAVLADPAQKAVLTENRSDAVTAILTQAGYREVSYDAFRHFILPAGESPLINGLFVRDRETVAARVESSNPFQVLGQCV